MEIVIGPILERACGYAFDIWTPRDGVSHGYTYRRIDDAIYAHKATIRAAAASASLPLVCQTVEEFAKRSLGSDLLEAA
jgi:hypothetical protein